MLSKVLPNFGSLQVHDIMWLAQELLHVLYKSVSYIIRIFPGDISGLQATCRFCRT